MFSLSILAMTGLVAFGQVSDDDDGGERPSTGTGYLVAGSIMGGVGALNLILAPVCKLDFYVDSVGATGSDVCLYASLGVAAVGLGVGVPLFIVGLNKRSAYQEWKAAHPNVAVLLEISPYFDGRSAGLVWQTSL